MSDIATTEAPVREDGDGWVRRFLKAVAAWVQLAIIVIVAGLLLVIIGAPIALLVRGIAELVAWLAGGGS